MQVLRRRAVLAADLISHCITDRNIAARAAQADVIHLRDHALAPRKLLELARGLLTLGPKVIVNDRVDVAIAAAVHGVHLRSNPIPPRLWRPLVPAGFLIGVSCHSPEEIRQAEGADYVYFSPVFDSPGHGPAAGLEALREAVRTATMPVIALGGVTWENAPFCLEAGASGIAGIRLFQTVRIEH